MATTEELIELTKQMNALLEAEDVDKNWLEEVCNLWQNQTNIRFRLLDFEYYNESQLKTITEEKISYVKNQDFEGAANKREIEKKFIKHVTFKKEMEIEKSAFHFEENILVYLYTGTARNDSVLHSRLTSPEKGFFKKY
jgi:hypothetical protein